ncbi:hypothetical protein ACE1ET_09215 [Saccharicrinis sp. FJH62]|uniref:hypothetical protein n=1 Tax=Saccharicrinis sp. FJH62 TaxID=3344657 RepID=UPI0035D52079
MKNNIVLYIFFIVINFGCTHKSIEFNSKSRTTTYSYKKLFDKSPYLIQEIDSVGEIVSQVNYVDDELYSSFVLDSITGDSIYNTYYKNGEFCYTEVYNQSDTTIFFPYKNKKLYGIAKYYLKGELVQRILFYNDRELAYDLNIPIDKDDVLFFVLKDISNTKKDSVIEIVNESLKTYVYQYSSSNTKHEIYSIGAYFIDNHNNIVDSISDYINLVTPDSLSLNSALTVKIMGRKMFKNSIINVHFSEIDSFCIDSLGKYKINSKLNVLDSVLIPLKNIDVGHHFLIGVVEILNTDSTLLQNFYVYNDFYVAK